MGRNKLFLSDATTTRDYESVTTGQIMEILLIFCNISIVLQVTDSMAKFMPALKVALLATLLADAALNIVECFDMYHERSEPVDELLRLEKPEIEANKKLVEEEYMKLTKQEMESRKKFEADSCSSWMTKILNRTRKPCY